jgi:hypothetical protein
MSLDCPKYRIMFITAQAVRAEPKSQLQARIPVLAKERVARLKRK